MMKLKYLSLALAGCLLVGSAAESAHAQSRRDRDWDRGQDWEDDRDWRGRDRDRDWDRGRRWSDRDRGQDCYTVRREYRDRVGDIIIRRYRVCED